MQVAIANWRSMRYGNVYNVIEIAYKHKLRGLTSYNTKPKVAS